MTYRLLLGALAALALTGPARAGDFPATLQALFGLEREASATLYERGRASMLELRLDRAEELFKQLGAAEPESPAGAFGLQTNAFWRALLSEEDADTDRFFALNDSLQSVIERAPKNGEEELLRATATLHRALVLLRAERYPRGGLTLRDACGQFRDLADKIDTLPDVGFGLGVCETAAGSVPRSYRWLARLFGFSGTVPGGLAWMRRAADGGGLQAVEAVMGLAMADATLNEQRADGLERLQAEAAQNPESPALAYLEGYQLLLARRAPEAEAALRRAKESLTRAGSSEVPYVDAHLGLAVFRQDRFAESIPLLESYLAAYNGRALVAQTTLHAGLAHELTGDRRRAVSYYRRVRAARDYDSDLSAKREAERLIDAPLTQTQRALLMGETAFDSGRYDLTVTRLQPIVTDASLTEVERAEAAYRTGRAYQETDRFAEARRHFQLAVDRPGDAKAKWGPWALYHIAETQEEEGNLAEARRGYQDVLRNENDFDYAKSLEQRTRAALDRIGG